MAKQEIAGLSQAQVAGSKSRPQLQPRSASGMTPVRTLARNRPQVTDGRPVTAAGRSGGGTRTGSARGGPFRVGHGHEGVLTEEDGEQGGAWGREVSRYRG